MLGFQHPSEATFGKFAALFRYATPVRRSQGMDARRLVGFCVPSRKEGEEQMVLAVMSKPLSSPQSEDS
jgi:hypothetical protein